MRTVIGIDVSKATSEVAILSGEILVKRLKIDNNFIGFEQLNTVIQQAEIVPEIIFEATGIYSRRLQSFLEQHHYPYIRMNPLSAKKDMDRLRPNKNDVNDAYNLAQSQMVLRRVASYVEKPVYQELMRMSRYYQQCNHDLVTQKNRLHRALQETFPELEHLLSTTDGDQYWSLVQQFPHSGFVVGHSLDTLRDTILGSTRRNISSVRATKLAEKLFELASISFAAVSTKSHLVYEVNKLAGQLIELRQEKKDTIKQMVELAQNLPEYDVLLSIPGFAETTVVSLIAELGDIRRFGNPNKLNAYVGIDLRFNDSGDYKSAGFITKRGNTIARKILFKAIGNIVSAATHGHQCHINDWYLNKKRSSTSKGMKKITIGAMDRLLSTIHHLVLTNQRYDYDIATKHCH